jgi:hypothetical protein
MVDRYGDRWLHKCDAHAFVVRSWTARTATRNSLLFVRRHVVSYVQTQVHTGACHKCVVRTIH